MTQFLYLQLLDALTTLAFLARGVEEANPLVAAAMKVSPLGGLVLIKLAAVGLGVYVARTRPRLLLPINAFYALLIIWNLCALILAELGPAAPLHRT